MQHLDVPLFVSSSRLILRFNILLFCFDLVSHYLRTLWVLLRGYSRVSWPSLSDFQCDNCKLTLTSSLDRCITEKHIWSIVKKPSGYVRWMSKNPEEKRRCGFTVRARVSLGMKDGGLEESALAPAAICINTAQLPRAGSSLPSPGGADGYSTAYPGYTER